MDVYNKSDEKEIGHRSKTDVSSGKVSNKKPSNETSGDTSVTKGNANKKKKTIKPNAW